MNALQVATAICVRLQNAGFMALFVGGCVRDTFLGVTPKDYDVATNADPIQVRAIFGNQAKATIGFGEDTGVVLVAIDGLTIEVATFRSESGCSDGRRPDKVELLTEHTAMEALRLDAERRDLTINAMYCDPISGAIHDFFGGREDIVARLLRAVGDASTRIIEHPSRMLRAVRFMSQTGFALDSQLHAAIRDHARDLRPGDKTPWETIAKELEKTLLGKEPVAAMELLMECGLMAEILPEMLPMCGELGEQDSIWHPEGNAWVHTLMVLAEAAKEDSQDKSFAFMLGVLLHDIAKPNTKETRVENHDGRLVLRISNNKHDKVGAEMAAVICDRLRLPKETRQRVCDLVELHMSMHRFNDPGVKPGTLVKLLQRPDIMDLIKLQHADAMGTGRTEEERQRASLRQFYLEKIASLNASPVPAQRLNAPALVDGALLKAHGFNPGPIFKLIKGRAFVAQHQGEFADLEGANQWLIANAETFRAMTAAEIALQLQADEAQPISSSINCC
jgi:putative nucleotidyltransferase with HDIG domain